MTIDHAFFRIGFVSIILALSAGCDDEGGESDSEENADMPGATGPGPGSGQDSASQACSDACGTLTARAECSAAGIDAATCGSLCQSSACAACLSDSAVCGEDCEAACQVEGGDSSEDPDGDDSGEPAPEPECTSDEECGVGFACVTCRLNDDAGWCEPAQQCSSVDPCDSGKVCGHWTDGSEYHCIAERYCE